MMQSSHQEHFFETDASQAERRRRAEKAGNEHGNPIVLPSKLTAVIPDPSAPHAGVFVAESAGNVRRIALETGETKTVYRGPKAPLTSVAIGGTHGEVVFSGCWDGSVWSWDLASGKPLRRYVGHSDFVKAVVCVGLSGTPCLVSGGADKTIVVWNVETGARIHKCRDPAVAMMAVNHLAVDPFLSTPDEAVLVSAGSDPHIRRWRITLGGYERLAEEQPAGGPQQGGGRPTILEHETSVYRLFFDAGSDLVDLWTASADGSAVCLSRAKAFAGDDVFVHGDHVRAVVANDNFVVTAGRDEDIKVWSKASGQLRAVLEGHYDEVTDMALLRDPARRRDRLCSVSLDGTVRTWPLGHEELDEVVAAARKAKEDEGSKKDGKGSTLTAEEEAELAELMGDD